MCPGAGKYSKDTGWKDGKIKEVQERKNAGEAVSVMANTQHICENTKGRKKNGREG